jgi:LPS-assembly protein
MPTVGLEYRYPFLAVHSWGTETIEPIAQIIARPNENRNTKLPNEDSQSLIFDDSNLFKLDKFAGWDRTEGGGRANVGVQYTAQFNKAGYFNAVFGQSYQIFGENSFATGDLTNTGLDSGLDKSASDYVARATYAPNQTYSLTASTRLDQKTLASERLELEGRAAFDRFSTSVLYGHYAPQPELGFLTNRDGILTAATYKLTTNWNLMGGVTYDLDAHQVASTQFGIGYIDDCVILALRYSSNYIYSGNPQDNGHLISLSLTLRTLGGPTVNQRVGGLPGGF